MSEKWRMSHAADGDPEMLNWLSKELLLAVSISLAVALAVVSLVGPPYRDPTLEQIEYQEASTVRIVCGPNCTSEDSTSDGKGVGFLSRLVAKASTDPVAILTGVLGIATFILAGTVLRQTRDARRSSEQQLRAYVFVTTCVVRNLIAGGIPEGDTEIENSGQTPAFGLTHIQRAAFVDFPLKEPLPSAVSDENFSRIDLGPRGKSVKHAGHGQISATQVEALMLGTKALYLCGEIRYIDAFRRPQHTKYRYMMGGNVGYRMDGAMVACEDGNEAT